MAKTAIARGATHLLSNLPEEILVWEILVLLPPKSLLRCRAVCRDWHRATSTPDFLQAQHACQPNLPILCGYDSVSFGECNSGSLYIIPLDHRAGLTAADQLQSVARMQTLAIMHSCDGLLFLYTRDWHHTICNPATRQYASLWQIDDFTILGVYLHRHTGEYRLLLYLDRLMDDKLPPALQHGCHVFTLGSCQQPRHIGWPEAEELLCEINVLFGGSLHWYPTEPESKRGKIMVFNTTAESFRQMHAPVLPGDIDLFEMDGMLVLASFNDATTVIGIWILQDYESEGWTFKCQIKLPVEEMTPFQKFDNSWDVLVTSSGDDVLILVRFDEWLLQIDIDGKLVATFNHKCLCAHTVHLKQSLVQHTFFPALDGYVVNKSAFHVNF